MIRSRPPGRRHGYAQVKVQTAGPAQCVIMLYDGMVKHLNLALAAFASEDPESVEVINVNIVRVNAILAELRLALDHTANGGELAEKLDHLYSYWQSELHQAALTHSSQRASDVLGMVTSLREAWDEVARSVSS